MEGAVRHKPVETMTETELAEALRDWRWRIRNLYKIKDKDGNTVTFTPNEAQEQFLDELWYRNLVPKARQRGFSTVKQILMLDTALFEVNKTTAIIAQDKQTATSIRNGKILFAYDRLPAMVRSMVKLTKRNEQELGWDNGSNMSVSSSARGGTIDMLHVSEYGIICVENPEMAREIQEGSLPAVPKFGVCTVESTVESPYGIFSDMVREASSVQKLGRNLTPIDFRLHFASWWDAKEYEIDPTGIPISPEEHAYFARMEAAIGREISLPKRAWYVTILRSTFGREKAKMWRQYPTTLEEAFSIASSGLWFADQMAGVRTERRIGNLPLIAGVPVNTFWDIGTGDETAIWLHQLVGPWDHFVGYFESSGEPPAFYARKLQEMQSERKFTFGTHFLPHDGAHRRINAERLITYRDMLEELGLLNIEVVPRAANVGVEIDLVRQDFGSYRFDEVWCKEGIEHLDGFSKKFNRTVQTFTSEIEKNGHQHAADAIRQVASARKHGLLARVGIIMPYGGNGKRAPARASRARSANTV